MLLSAIGHYEVSIPDHIDIYLMTQEMTPAASKDECNDDFLIENPICSLAFKIKFIGLLDV